LNFTSLLKVWLFGEKQGESKGEMILLQYYVGKYETALSSRFKVHKCIY